MSTSVFFRNAAALFAADPSVFALQIAMTFFAFLIVYAVLFVTRDVILRSHSFLFQIFCILLSAVPVVGVLVYILIRPSTTIFERSMMRKFSEMHHSHHGGSRKHHDKHKKPEKRGEK